MQGPDRSSAIVWSSVSYKPETALRIHFVHVRNYNVYDRGYMTTDRLLEHMYEHVYCV